MRVAFFGSPELAVPSLRGIAAAHEVVWVVTQPDRPAGRGRQLRPPAVKVAALELGLPVAQPASVKTAAFRRELARRSPDLAVVVAYGRVLGPKLLAVPPAGFWNVHASLLPRWRGASPIQWAILSGDPHSGVSIMRVVPALDAGPVLIDAVEAITPDDDAGSLGARLADLGARLILQGLKEIGRADGDPEVTPQDDSRSTYAPLIKKQDGRLRWGEDAASLERRVRAFRPWPGAFTPWRNQTLKVLGARVVSAAGEGGPGTVLQADPGAADSLVVRCGDGALSLLQVQRPGKDPLPASDFLRGARLSPGERFGGDEDPVAHPRAGRGSRNGGDA